MPFDCRFRRNKPPQWAIELLLKVDLMTAALDRLTAEVANMKTVELSAVTLINGLAQRVRDAATAQAAGDDTALNALADDIDATASDLANAVSANTATPANPVTPGTTAPAAAPAPVGDSANGASESAGPPPEETPPADTTDSTS